MLSGEPLDGVTEASDPFNESGGQSATGWMMYLKRTLLVKEALPAPSTAKALITLEPDSSSGVRLAVLQLVPFTASLAAFQLPLLTWYQTLETPTLSLALPEATGAGLVTV